MTVRNASSNVDNKKIVSKVEGSCSLVNRKSYPSHKGNVEKLCEDRESLRVFYANSRSLGNKINELRAIASSEKPDII